MADEGIRDGMVAPSKREEDSKYDLTLRPKTLREYIGQRAHKENLEVFVQAALARDEPLEHVLIHGPPGLGKTTLSQILANELGVQMHATSGPAIEHNVFDHLTQLGL